jgi:hypothetical protein
VRFGAQEGQSLILVVLSMVTVIAIAALAIDVATWYQKHHSAQVTADAAALAAANYMANGGVAGTATGTATAYAASNGTPIANGNVIVDTSNDTVTVTVPTSGSINFAGLDLGSSPNISARAVATWAKQDCGVAAGDCAFMFAADPVCSGDTGVTGQFGTGNQTTTFAHGISVSKSGAGNSPGIQGGVISASNITTSVNGGQSWPGAATYSSGSGCGFTGRDPFAATYQRVVSSAWPIDYSKIYPACPGTSTLFGSVSCDSSGFPSYCSQSLESYATSETISSTTANAIYCDSGSGSATSALNSDPSKWTGTIVQNGSGSATYVAGTVQLNIPTNSTVQPATPSSAAGNRLLVYAAACNASTPSPPITCNSSQTTTNPAVSFGSSGNANVIGDVFAPAGTIESSLGGTPTFTGFLEGWDVVYNANGTTIGQGPPITPGDVFIQDYLTG